MGSESVSRSFRPGQKFQPSARWLNGLNALLSQQQGERAAPLLADTSTVLSVRNDTGADLPRFSVVNIGDPVIDYATNPDEFLNSRVYAGTTPTPYASTFAITQEPIPEDAVGKAVVFGETACTIHLVDEADEFASPGTTTADLESGPSGPARILWRDPDAVADDEGVAAKVLLTGFDAGRSSVLQIQAGASNSLGYPALVQTWDATAGSWSDASTTEVRVEDPNGGSWAEDDYVVAMFVGLSAGGVASYAAVPPGAGGSATPYVLFHPLSSSSTAASTQTREFTVLPETGYWALTLNVDINISSATRFYYGFYEATYGGGPAAGSIEFVGAGADNAGASYNAHIGGGTPPCTAWRLQQAAGSGQGEAWNVVTYARTDEADVKLGVWGKVVSPITFQFVGSAFGDYYTSLTAHKIGDL